MHWNANFDSLINSEKCSIMRKKIPKGTTSIAQPLDTGFNHHFKYFIKKFNDRIKLDELDLNIKSRETIITVFSLAWNQMSSPKFQGMLKYCWISSGYCNEKISFKNVRELCFITNSNDCNINECTNNFYIRCAYCNLNLCLYHFYNEYHIHEL